MVAQTASRTIVANADGNRNFPYLNQNGKRWDLNWNWTNNDLNSNGRIASSGKCGKFSRICLAMRLRLGRLPQPPAEHFPDTIQFFRKYCVMFCFKRFYFPCNLNKKFQKIESPNCFFKVGRFLLFWEVTCYKNNLNSFEKHAVDFFS